MDSKFPGGRLHALVEREAQVQEGVGPDGRAGGEQQAHLDSETLFHLEHGSKLNIIHDNPNEDDRRKAIGRVQLKVMVME